MKLFFDTETTGLPKDYNAPSNDVDNWPRLVQLGWLVVDDNEKMVSQGNYIIKPEGFVIPEESSSVHGITNDKAKEQGCDLLSVLRIFAKELIDADEIIGHNINFDIKVVDAEFIRNGVPARLRDAKSFCTMQESTNFCKLANKNGFSSYKWPNLQELHTKLFGVGFEDAHDAMIDILATKKCYYELIKQLNA